MPDVIVVRSTQNASEDSLVNQLREAHNDLVAKFEAVLAKLDADAGVTDTNYAALHGDATTVVYE